MIFKMPILAKNYLILPNFPKLAPITCQNCQPTLEQNMTPIFFKNCRAPLKIFSCTHMIAILAILGPLQLYNIKVKNK